MSCVMRQTSYIYLFYLVFGQSDWGCVFTGAFPVLFSQCNPAPQMTTKSILVISETCFIARDFLLNCRYIWSTSIRELFSKKVKRANENTIHVWTMIVQILMVNYCLQCSVQQCKRYNLQYCWWGGVNYCFPIPRWRDSLSLTPSVTHSLSLL